MCKKKEKDSQSHTAKDGNAEKDKCRSCRKEGQYEHMFSRQAV